MKNRILLYLILVSLLATNLGGQVALATSVADCDVNSDGAVNVLDLIMVGQHWSETGAPGWIPEDINEDGTIDVLDNILIGQNWAESYDQPPSISLISPTDDDDATVTRNWTEVNVSIDSATNTSGFIDWDRSLVGHWDFDENSGATVSDESTYVNNGTLIDDPQWTTGKFGSALRFDGNGGFVDCGNNGVLDITDEITIEAWINPSVAGEGTKDGIVAKAENGAAWSWQMRYGSPAEGNYMGIQFNGDPEGSTWVFVNQNLTPGEWYHIVGVFDGSNIKCYLNGVEKDTNQISAITGCNSDVVIGYDGSLNNVFNGTIDEVRIWNRSLSSNEIRASYNSTTNSLNRQFTSLTTGAYQYYAYVTDTNGNAAQTETRTLTIEEPPDTTTPAAVTNLSVSNETTSSITLAWTAPGDDGNTGIATSYDIRYSTSNITSGNWASATQVSGEPAPGSSGSNESFTVTGLSSDTTYYFAIKTNDEVPNQSDLSNVASSTTLSGGGVVYLQSSFAYEGGPFVEGQNWWSAGAASYPCEVGHWDSIDYSGNTPTGGDIRLVEDPTDPSRLCLEFELTQPGARPLSENQHTKLWDHADKGWAMENQVTEAYYQGEVYIPTAFTYGANIFQFGQSAGYGCGQMPISRVGIRSDGHIKYQNKLKDRVWHDLGELPVSEWLEICVYLKESSDYYTANGEVKIWINDVLMYSDNTQRLGNLCERYGFYWSINNYGDDYEPQGKKVLWRNVIVSSEKM